MRTLLLLAVICTTGCQAIGQTGGHLETHEEVELDDHESCLIMVGKKLFALKDIQAGYEAEISNSDSYLFRFCEPILPSKAFAVRKRSNKSYPLTINQDLLDAYVFTENDALVISRNSTEKCRMDENKNHTFSVLVECGRWEEPHLVDNQNDQCDLRVKMSADFGCPIFSLNYFLRFIGLAFVMFGVFLTVCATYVQKDFSSTLVKIFMFVLIMQILGALHFYTRQISQNNALLFVLAALLSACAAIFFGRFFRTQLRFGPIILGVALAITAAMAALPMVEMGIQKITKNEQFDIGPLPAGITIGVAAFSGIYLAHKFAFFILVSAQAFMSAYLIVRGISMNLGGFPDEQIIIRDIIGIESVRESQLLKPDVTFIIYIALMFVLTAFSIRYQISLVLKKNFDRSRDNPNSRATWSV